MRQNNAVGMTVTTDGAAGSTDTIPIGDLRVRDSAAASKALSAEAPVVVFSRSARSPPGGRRSVTTIG